MKLGEGVKVFGASMTFTQESDCCEDGDLGQDITISTHDGGGGPYLVIETKRWAIDCPEDIAELCKTVLDLVRAEKGAV